ncbi:PAS and ANTAR domain-containing protein [Arthrobacter sp. 92]|uniref:PAS and ANTAR domain-containing protein n=1 Tax=Arthrobacter sp. 92 TaxID=3418175 RepID=UPI003D03D4D8
MWSKLVTYLYPLGPGAECPSGTFECHISSGKMQWSEGMFGIHGLRPGEVVPTLELFMAHKHPLDRKQVLSLWAALLKGGGQGALLHRINDIHGKERRVFSAIQAVAGPTGQVDYVHGFMVDVTQSLRIESQDAASEAIERAYAHRYLIEQAKGIVMAIRGVDGPAAFDVLAAGSQLRNTKLRTVAEDLVHAASTGKAAEQLAGLLIRTDP